MLSRSFTVPRVLTLLGLYLLSKKLLTFLSKHLIPIQAPREDPHYLIYKEKATTPFNFAQYHQSLSQSIESLKQSIAHTESLTEAQVLKLIELEYQMCYEDYYKLKLIKNP